MSLRTKAKLCGFLMPKAKNGTNRRKCRRLKNHNGFHKDGTCYGCAFILTVNNSSASVARRGTGMCRSCHLVYQRNMRRNMPQNRQVPGNTHLFPCDCTGTLPSERRKTNIFAVWGGRHWGCRASEIIRASRATAKKWLYKPINPSTSHSCIRKMMEERNCYFCLKPLKWEFGVGKTPHLHHNHDTGEPYGFSHARCNMRAIEHEIARLRYRLSKYENPLTGEPNDRN